MTKMMEDNKIHQFLMGPDDEVYSTIQSQILALDPLPSLDKIFNMIQQEENHKKMMMNRDVKQENVAVFAVSHHVRATPSPGERSTCKHCGKYGHDEAGCFELIGYPPDWGTRGG